MASNKTQLLLLKSHWFQELVVYYLSFSLMRSKSQSWKYIWLLGQRQVRKQANWPARNVILSWPEIQYCFSNHQDLPIDSCVYACFLVDYYKVSTSAKAPRLLIVIGTSKQFKHTQVCYKKTITEIRHKTVSPFFQLSKIQHHGTWPQQVSLLGNLRSE